MRSPTPYSCRPPRASTIEIENMTHTCSTGNTTSREDLLYDTKRRPTQQAARRDRENTPPSGECERCSSASWRPAWRVRSQQRTLSHPRRSRILASHAKVLALRCLHESTLANQEPRPAPYLRPLQARLSSGCCPSHRLSPACESRSAPGFRPLRPTPSSAPSPRHAHTCARWPFQLRPLCATCSS